MAREKPPIESLVKYLKEQLPGCGITDAEIDDLRRLYPNVSYSDVNRVFHQAINNHAMQPISYMNQQLRVIRPEADPFNSQLNQTRARANGRRVETGTDWSVIYAKMDAERIQERTEYDSIHGAGSYDRKNKRECIELKQNIIEFGKKVYAENHPNAENEAVENPDDWSEEKKRWYDDLVKGAIELGEKRKRKREAEERKKREKAKKPTQV